MWDPQLDALPSQEGAAAIAAIMYLKMAERNLRKLRLSPTKRSLPFEALVARMAAPDIGRTDEQDPRDLYEVAHRLRDSRTVVAGSPLRNGPYGDLFHRALWGWGTVIDLAYQDRMGYVPQIDPIDTVPAPDLRHFLDAAVGRYADALMQSPTGTTDGQFPQTLRTVATHFGNSPPQLVVEVRSQEPFVSRVQGIDYLLPYEQYLDMTGDADLSERAVKAEAV